MMNLNDCQREMRSAFLGGFAGQLVSGAIWLIAAALGTWLSSVAGMAALYHETWFFPAAMIVVGSHYLPFITLYGLKLFGVLAALLVVAGAGLALYGPPSSAWAGG